MSELREDSEEFVEEPPAAARRPRRRTPSLVGAFARALEPDTGHGGLLRPFPRRDRAIRAAVGETVRGPSDAPLADPFEEMLDVAAPTREQRGVLDPDSRALRDVRRRERAFRWALVLADSAVAAAAVPIAMALWGGYTIRAVYLLVIPVMVLAAKIGGLYDRDELVIDHSTLNELPRLLNLATMLALLVWLARHFVVYNSPKTGNLLLLWALLSGGLVAARSVARALARRLAPVERCLLVGRPSVFARLEAKFHGRSGLFLVGAVDSSDVSRDHSHLRVVAEREHIQRIIIDTDATNANATLEIVRAANATGLHVSLLPSMLGAVGSSVVFDDIGGMVLMGVPPFGLTRSSRALKRAFDLFAAAGTLILTAPLMLLIALAIKLDTRGPLLFRQTRMGRHDTPFQMLKFRSMVDGADALKDSLRELNEAAGGLFKIDSDPRVTRAGRFLRRSGLDELPQLLNVLAGSMSLVGPRPLVIDEDRRVTGFDRRRLHLTPGITGRWQTLGAARVPLDEMVKIDYLYIANWSPWLDIKIMVETVGYILRRDGQ